MHDLLMLSAPEEPYEDHVKLCLDSWVKIRPRMLYSLARLFEVETNLADKAIEITIVCHDIGKLSEPWQRYIQKPKAERRFGPPHATLGAAYLMGISEESDRNLIFASVLAILMHHTDSGLAQGNLEHPAEDAINKGIAVYGAERIRWAEGADETFRRTAGYAPGIEHRARAPLSSVTLESLETMADTLRLWARCPKELERHRHRMQALAIHHILKVCDWRAAAQRPRPPPGRPTG